jgi:hypothetical protein
MALLPQGAADVLVCTVDFCPQLAPLDAIATVSATSDAADGSGAILVVASVASSGTAIVIGIGPASDPGTYQVAISGRSQQGRVVGVTGTILIADAGAGLMFLVNGCGQAIAGPAATPLAFG